MHSHDRPAPYKIIVTGHLSDHWRQYLPAMALSRQVSGSGVATTELCGVMRDQAALRGLLTELWDLGLVVVSVSRLSDPDMRDQTRGK